MTIEEALVQLLSADAGVSAIVGTPARIYPQQAPQSQAPPYITYAVSDPEQQMSQTGYMNLYVAQFRFDCYGSAATGYASAKALAAAVRACLFGFLRGQIGTVGVGGINVQGIFDNGGEDCLDPPVHSEEQGQDYVGVQIRLWFNVS